MPVIQTIIPEKNLRIGLWHITEPEKDLRSLIVLNPFDEKLFERMKNEKRRKQWLAYRVLLQQLWKEIPIEIVYDRFGKPGVSNIENMTFSASHSGEYAAVIAGLGFQVGIDIEKITPRLLRVKERFLSEGELNDIGPSHDLDKLSIYWCGKEALYKVYGRPEVDLRNDIYIHSFEYICNTSGYCRASLTCPEIIKEFTLCYKKLGDYMLAYTHDQRYL